MVWTGCLRARASVTIRKNANTALRATATEGFLGDGGCRPMASDGSAQRRVTGNEQRRWVGVLWGEESHSRQCGEKNSGVLGRGTKDSRRSCRKKRRWTPPKPTDVIRRGQRARQPPTEMRPGVRARQGPGGEEGLLQPSTPPTMAGAAGQGQAPLPIEERN